MKIDLNLAIESTIQEMMVAVALSAATPAAVRYMLDGIPSIPDVPLDPAEVARVAAGGAFIPVKGGQFVLDSGTYHGTAQLVLSDGSLVGDPFPFMVNIPVMKIPVITGVKVTATPA